MKLDYSFKWSDNRKEKQFRNFVATRINEVNHICKKDLIESGAEKSKVSINTAKNYLLKMTSSEGELGLFEHKCNLTNCDGWHIYEKDKGMPENRYF